MYILLKIQVITPYIYSSAYLEALIWTTMFFTSSASLRVPYWLGFGSITVQASWRSLASLLHKTSYSFAFTRFAMWAQNFPLALVLIPRKILYAAAIHRTYFRTSSQRVRAVLVAATCSAPTEITQTDLLIRVLNLTFQIICELVALPWVIPISHTHYIRTNFLTPFGIRDPSLRGKFDRCVLFPLFTECAHN